MTEKQHTILLVEDDRAVQRTLAEALHQSGFTVLAEHDGEWARSTFAQRRVDLVVLDAVLPRRNGFQLAIDIRRSEKGRKLPIVLFSGIYDPVKVKAQIDEIAPPVRFLEKPVVPSQLVAIENYYRVSRSEQKILDALAWWEAAGFTAPSRRQVGYVAGYRPGGATTTSSAA